MVARVKTLYSSHISAFLTYYKRVEDTELSQNRMSLVRVQPSYIVGCSSAVERQILTIVHISVFYARVA